MKAVIDTNILVSALWKSEGNAYSLLLNIINGIIRPCYDSRIMEEYQDVLLRPKFHFSTSQVKFVLDIFIDVGEYVNPQPLLNEEMIDEDDRAFYEVAKYCNCNVPLVTGNLRHFPKDNLVMSLYDFCKMYL